MMQYTNIQYQNSDAISFWENAEKAVGKCPHIDLQSGTIDEIDIKESIRHAFHDLTARTMEKNSENKGKSLSYDGMSEACCAQKDGLYTLVDAWIKKTSTFAFDFDSWHKEACDQVISFLNQYYVPKDCTYGKAQKIVNMTFKNLYALCVKKGIADTYTDRFQGCHVPLDSFTLEWFYRNDKKNITKGKILNWSGINAYGDENTELYSADKSTYYTYFYFQKIFRSWYPGNPTALQAEFVMWSDIQKEMTAESFYFALKNLSKEDRNKFKELPLAKKLAEIKNAL